MVDPPTLYERSSVLGSICYLLPEATAHVDMLWSGFLCPGGLSPWPGGLSPWPRGLSPWPGGLSPGRFLSLGV